MPRTTPAMPRPVLETRQRRVAPVLIGLPFLGPLARRLVRLSEGEFAI